VVALGQGTQRRYFYGHTWLADANFEYHGNPVVILRGRLIAVAGAGVYWIVDTSSRMTNLVVNTASLSTLGQLHCMLSARALSRLYAVNLIAIARAAVC